SCHRLAPNQAAFYDSMKTNFIPGRTFAIFLFTFVLLPQLPAQTLLNVDFGVGSRSLKSGFAATGQSTNDFWNLYRHYDPKFVPGEPLVSDGILRALKQADGSASRVIISVTNAPGVWGNASGDPRFAGSHFPQNGSTTP